MSIYCPEPPEAELATEPDNRALKALLDAQVGLRVLKAGDAMTGELQMGGNVIRGLPQVYPPSGYLGDEAISWSEVVRLLREALETWENSKSPIEPNRKPLITVWPEESGALDEGYEWSFGNGCNQHATLSYVMPTPGRIKTMTLCVVPKRVAARVGLVEEMCPIKRSTNQPLREQASYPGLKLMSWLQEMLSHLKPFGVMMKREQAAWS